MNLALCNCFSPVAVVVANAYGVNTMVVNMCTLCYFVCLPMSFTSMWLYNKMNSATVLRIGISMVLCGAWLRMVTLINNNFYWVLTGTVVMTLSGPIFNVALTLIINKWFPIKELAKSLSLLSIAGALGSVLSFMWSGILFQGLNNDNTLIIAATHRLLWQ